MTLPVSQGSSRIPRPVFLMFQGSLLAPTEAIFFIASGDLVGSLAVQRLLELSILRLYGLLASTLQLVTLLVGNSLIRRYIILYVRNSLTSTFELGDLILGRLAILLLRNFLANIISDLILRNFPILLLISIGPSILLNFGF